MRKRNSLKSVFGKEAGASLVEYALTLALIAVVAIVSVSAMGERAKAPFNEYALALACNGDGTKCGDETILRGK